MRTINPFSHIPFIHARLMSFLIRDSFAWKLRRTIGNELDYRLIGKFEDDEEYGDFTDNDRSRWFPIEELFLWIAKNGGLAATELEDDDGGFLDDGGESLNLTSAPSLSGIEQLAAYGLWLMDEEMNCCGPSTETDWDDKRINPNGWTETEVLNHKAECLLLAYQALSYAQRLQSSTQLTTTEIETAARIDYSAMGAKGAKKRHARMKELEKWAIVQYRVKTWPSANKAAYELKDCVMAHGRNIGANLTPDNAQRTIAEWFRKSV